MKKLILTGMACLFFGTPALVAQPGEEHESAIPMIASLDSMTWLLHNNGFIKNASFVNSKELDFSEKGDLAEFPGALVQQRMNALGSEVQLEYNNYVKGFIDLYGRRKKDLTSKILALSDYYFPIYEEILDKNNLPLELKYLSVVESALNPKATSWAGASGPWQFIYATGIRYGLTINSYVDERRDIYKSTQAACDYFHDSYKLYGDWLLVIASYNCGPGNVNKAIRRSGGSKNFWEIQRYLPKETRGYVPAFIAVAYLMNYAKEHGIAPMEIDMHRLVQAVEVEQFLTFEQLASALDLSKEHIYDLNPHYKKEMVPDVTNCMTVYLPYEKAMLYCSLRDSIGAMPMYDDNGKPYRLEIETVQVRYKVKKGDNLYSVAKKYNVSPADIKEWNVISKNRVVPGRYLTIHVEKKERVYLDAPDQPVLVKKVEEDVSPSAAVYHTVKSGDTLYSICKQYNLANVELIRKWNNLGDGDLIKPGTVLKVTEGS